MGSPRAQQPHLCAHRELAVEAVRQELAALLSSVQLLREGNPGRKIAEIQGKLATVPRAWHTWQGPGPRRPPPTREAQIQDNVWRVGQGPWNQPFCCWLCIPQPLRVPVGAPTWTFRCWGTSTVTGERAALRTAESRLVTGHSDAASFHPGARTLSWESLLPQMAGVGLPPGAADSLRPCVAMNGGPCLVSEPNDEIGNQHPGQQDHPESQV